MVGGGGGFIPNLMLRKNLQNPKVLLWWWGWGGIQLPTFDADSKSAKIPKSLHGGLGGGSQLPSFDAESKSAKIPKNQKLPSKLSFPSFLMFGAILPCMGSIEQHKIQ